MTKAGARSPIRDIRLFRGRGGFSYVEGCHPAVAFGRRAALWLRSQGHSFGAWTHLYIRIEEGDPADESVALSQGLEWWHGFADVVVPRGFASLRDAERSDILVGCIRRALHAALPAESQAVDAACELALSQAENIRFLVKRKKLAAQQVDASFNVAEFPACSSLFVSVTDLTTGRRRETPPIALRHYQEASSLLGDLALAEEAVIITPNRSFTAQIIAEHYADFLRAPLSDASTGMASGSISNLIVGPI